MMNQPEGIRFMFGALNQWVNTANSEKGENQKGLQSYLDSFPYVFFSLTTCGRWAADEGQSESRPTRGPLKPKFETLSKTIHKEISGLPVWVSAQPTTQHA